ncbi:MAG: response regulator transcription factor [Actinobacteria bacterium]|nr:response regulator transcription factor [Actinomycetota bacterium]
MARVLIVEDDDAVKRQLDFILSREGNEVFSVEDGEAGFNMFQEVKPDLVITDCLIPKLDGFKLLAKIRALPEGAGTPVIMMSAIYKKDHYQMAAMKAGASAFMIKPVEPDELLAKMAELTAGGGAGRQESQGGFEPPGPG